MKREEPDVLRSRSLASLEGEELVEVDRLRAFGLRIRVEKVAWLISPMVLLMIYCVATPSRFWRAG